MKELRSKKFANGIVYALETHDGMPIEVTDTFLPFYTRDAIGRQQNTLKSSDLGSRSDRWMIGVSVMSGCPVRCKFCATGSLKGWRNLTTEEIGKQVVFVLKRNEQDALKSREFKINYTRMGEPFLNLSAVQRTIECISKAYPNAHHYISTVGIKGSDFSWIKGNITLQLSLHSLDEKRRNWLIPYKDKMSIEELGQIRTGSNQKTTVNLTLVDHADFSIEKLREYFSPEHFFIKLSPINPNTVSNKHELGSGIIEAVNIA
jgi:adenine C2-methylase RlmN of 23S rRNA A2503 and tRNA A37